MSVTYLFILFFIFIFFNKRHRRLPHHQMICNRDIFIDELAQTCRPTSKTSNQLKPAVCFVGFIFLSVTSVKCDVK